MPYYLLGCLKNMSRYAVNVKHPLLSLKHHRLIQLLINRGLALSNPPPPIHLPQEAKIPQPEYVPPQEIEDMPEQIPLQNLQ